MSPDVSMYCTHHWTVTSECPMCLRRRLDEVKEELARTRFVLGMVVLEAGGEVQLSSLSMVTIRAKDVELALLDMPFQDVMLLRARLKEKSSTSEAS